MTNIFHIIPESLLKKMKINESNKLHYLEVIKGSKRTPLSFKFEDINVSKANLIPGEKESFFELANIIEEAWTNSRVESKFSEFVRRTRKEIKKDNNRLVKVSVEESKLIQMLWERTDIFSGKFEEYKNISYNDVILNITTSLVIVLTHCPDSLKYIINECEKRISSEKVKKSTHSIIQMSKKNNEKIKPGEKHSYFNYRDNSNDEFAILYQRKQPLFTTPYIRVNPELIDAEYRILAPYGYSLIQLNSNTTLFIFDSLKRYTMHNKIIKSFEEMNDKTFELVLEYFYENAVNKCVRNIVSNDEEQLGNFIDGIKPILGNSIFNDVNQLNCSLSDFNVSGTTRYEEFYKPVEELYEKIVKKFGANEELRFVYEVGFKIRTPENYVNKHISIRLKEEFTSLIKNEITMDEFLERNMVYANNKINYLVNIMRMDHESIKKSFFNIDVLHD